MMIEPPLRLSAIPVTTILGIGVDCEDCSRFKEIVEDSDVLAHIYTPREIALHRGNANYHQHLAGKFAAKEAVIKSLAGSGIPWVVSSIEIDNRPDGSPVVNLLDDRARGRFSVQVSISHTDQTAVAVAMAFVL